MVGGPKQPVFNSPTVAAWREFVAPLRGPDGGRLEREGLDESHRKSRSG